jgi:hypothetical protein
MITGYSVLCNNKLMKTTLHVCMCQFVCVCMCVCVWVGMCVCMRVCVSVCV